MTEEKARQYIADVLRAAAYEIEENRTVVASYSQNKDVQMKSGAVAINSKTFEYRVGLEDKSRLELEITTPPSHPDWIPSLQDY